MKKQILFMLTGLMLAVGAWAVIYETTGTDLQVWVKNRIVYTAKVTDIDSIATQETSDAKKIRMWVNKAVAYEVDVRGIDSITFAETVEPVEPDTLPTVNPDTISGTGTRLQVWVKNKIVYVAKVRDIDSIATEQTADANMIRVWVNKAVAYEANVAGIDSITFAATVEPVNPDTIPVIDPDTIPVIIPDTTKVDSITPIIPDTIPVVNPDTTQTINPDTIPTDTIPVVDCPEGALPGLFSVSADKRVYFSKGNLQYVGTWQFAEHQWDYFGSSQSNDHRDLFGWGTGIEPNKVSTSDSQYSVFDDWGGNPISNGGNKGQIWETLSQSEYRYILFTRENAASLLGLGTVNGINGLIILPDNWVLPAGATFNSVSAMGLESDGYEYSNSQSNNYSHNTYTAEEWSVMESAGAAFLPAAGYRNGTSTSTVGTEGNYWTSTPATSNTGYAGYLFISKKYARSNSIYYRRNGYSVRLVQPEVLDTAQQEPIRGKFSIGENKQVYFAPGNLQYQASTKTWRFAEHQYDALGEANANIADDYAGWIDLFGWGTGDKPTLYTDYRYYYCFSYHDWGMNPITYTGDSETHHWRAMSENEWNYLFKTRPNYDKLSGHAVVNGVRGYILLPDDWELPWGIVFYARTSSWTKNTYSLEQWEKMENAGAVFLPLTGYRKAKEVKSLDYGHYWLSTQGDLVYYGKSLDFYETGSAISGYTAKIETSNNSNPQCGYGVRLIEPVVPEVIPPDPEPIAHPEGAIPGIFSVSETKKVYFSKGNLQYSACGWKFAEHQWDTIGAGNANIETELGAPIDLFGWGTGDRPYLTSTLSSDYADAYVDWGVNPIINGGNTSNMWRTLTKDEWEYLLKRRPNCENLRCQANVNGVNGYIFLPDDWQLPYGGRFFGDQGWWIANVYTLEEWARMENAGAVFLPAAGSRSGTEVGEVNEYGIYWSSTPNSTTAYMFTFGQQIDVAGNPRTNNYQKILNVTVNVAFSVRLVKIAQ